jgi:hypothetical protein
MDTTSSSDTNSTATTADSSKQRKTPLFSLGQIVATPAVLEHFNSHHVSIQHYLSRHVCGDWGEICADDKAENGLSVEQGFRILSAYTVAGEKILIITEADRSSTCALFVSEY